MGNHCCTASKSAELVPKGKAARNKKSLNKSKATESGASELPQTSQVKQNESQVANELMETAGANQTDE